MKIDVEEVIKSELSMEDVLVLATIEYGKRGKYFPYSSVRQEEYISLYRRGVLNSNAEGYSISVTGYEEFRKVIGEKIIKTKKVEEVSDFEEFWSTYPVTDKHGAWLRTRGLKSNREKCKSLYKQAIKNGYNHEYIMKALKWEVKDRKEKSTTKNAMSYMKNSASWLFQREYETNHGIMKDTDSDFDSDDNWTEATV